MGAFPKKGYRGRISKKRVIKINIEGPFFVPNLFCGCLECKIYFAARLECKIYFAAAWSAKFILLRCSLIMSLFLGKRPVSLTSPFSKKY